MENKITRHTVDIAPSTIFWVLLVFLGMKFLAEISGILLLVFISFIVATAVNPIINWLETKKIPRALSSILVIFTLFGSLGFLISTFIKPLISQTQNFLNRLPAIIDQVSVYNINLESISTQAFNYSDQVFKIAIGTLAGIITTFTTLVISYYILQSRPKMKDGLKSLLGSKFRLYYSIITQVEDRLGRWVRGMIVLMLAVGLLSFLGYAAIGMPYAIALGVIAGILEIIPNIGPTITAIIAVLVGFSVSSTHGIAALIVSVLVQQLENNFLVPKVMQKTTGLNPIATIIALLIGYRLGGAALAVLSLPITLCVLVILSHLHVNGKNNLPEVD